MPGPTLLPTVPEAILSRRTPKMFDPDRLMPDDLLVRLLDLGAHAPSGFAPRPARFLIVRSERNRRRLRDCAFNHPLVTEAPVVVVVLGYKRGVATDLGPMLEDDVRLGLIHPDEAAEVRGRAVSFAGRSDAELAASALRGAILAASTLMLAAQGLGVDSAFLEMLDVAAIRQEFGVPDDHVVCGVIALGFALESSAFPRPFALEHACYEEHFGQPWTLGEPPPPI